MSMFITSAKMLILFVNNAINENTCIIRHFLRSQQMSDYGGYSIIRQFANPTFSSFPNECRIMQVPLYQVITLANIIFLAYMVRPFLGYIGVAEFSNGICSSQLALVFEIWLIMCFSYPRIRAH